jgi:hypothetical protein
MRKENRKIKLVSHLAGAKLMYYAPTPHLLLELQKKKKKAASRFVHKNATASCIWLHGVKSVRLGFTTGVGEAGSYETSENALNVYFIGWAK